MVIRWDTLVTDRSTTSWAYDSDVDVEVSLDVLVDASMDVSTETNGPYEAEIDTPKLSEESRVAVSVSYTHLTLPTIYSV